MDFQLTQRRHPTPSSEDRAEAPGRCLLPARRRGDKVGVRQGTEEALPRELSGTPLLYRGRARPPADPRGPLPCPWPRQSGQSANGWAASAGCGCSQRCHVRRTGRWPQCKGVCEGRDAPRDTPGKNRPVLDLYQSLRNLESASYENDEYQEKREGTFSGAGDGFDFLC